MSVAADTHPSAIVNLATNLRIGQYKRACPLCQHTRQKHSKDRPLSLSIDGTGVRYACHHCGAEGGWLHNPITRSEVPRFDPILLKEIVVPPSQNGAATVAREYLASRGIAESVIEAHTVSGMYQFNGHPVHAVGFPYRTEGRLAAVKWRSAEGDKVFSQQGVCEDLFLLDTYVAGNDILICEGEIDALSWLTVGLPENVTVVSIPNGAPAKVRDGKVDPNDDNKFRYLWRAKDKLDQAPRIYLSTDNDGPGRALAEEIARRVDRKKVWIVSLGEHKDASEALDLEGQGFLVEAFGASKPLPMLGLHVAEDFADPFQGLYDNGMPRGVSTGIVGLDKHMSVSPGQLTVVTGAPGSGKSDLVDQICLNLARHRGWKTVYCSFEKPVELHMVQLSEKLIGKPFFMGANIRMSQSDIEYAQAWLTDHFAFMDYRRGGPTQIDGILEAASAAVMRMGCRNLVIDPYNYVEVELGDDTKTEAVSKMLTKIQQWAKQHDCHVFFVAHPTKPPKDRNGTKWVPTGYDIADAAAWFSKADTGLTVWRDSNDVEPPEAHVWKIRWSWMGRMGRCKLARDPITTRWDDPVYVDDGYDWEF